MRKVQIQVNWLFTQTIQEILVGNIYQEVEQGLT